MKDVIVEDNLVENNGVGICVSRTAHGVLLRNNHFHNVPQPVWDEAAALAAAEQRIQEILRRARPGRRLERRKGPASMARTRRDFRDTTGHGFDAVGPGVQSAPEGGPWRGDQVLRRKLPPRRRRANLQPAVVHPQPLDQAGQHRRTPGTDRQALGRHGRALRAESLGRPPGIRGD